MRRVQSARNPWEKSLAAQLKGVQFGTLTIGWVARAGCGAGGTR